MKTAFLILLITTTLSRNYAQLPLGNLGVDMAGQLVNGSPSAALPGQWQPGVLCLADNCFGIHYYSPAMYADDFYRHQSEEVALAGNWMFSTVINTMPWAVRQDFDWFLLTSFQPVAAYAPVEVPLKFSYIPPKAPGSLPAPLFPVEKKILIQN